MDIDIIIKGGEELSEYYPKNYEAFQEKISDLIVEMFPGVGGWCLSSELTERHQAEKKKREEIQAREFKETFLRLLDEDAEVRELFQGKAASSAAEEVAHV
jgi:hypothetical protein